jgi:20S proteasome subunit alpha 3
VSYTCTTENFAGWSDLSVEFATLTVDPTTKKLKPRICHPAEVDGLLKKHQLAKREEDTEMRTA